MQVHPYAFVTSFAKARLNSGEYWDVDIPNFTDEVEKVTLESLRTHWRYLKHHKLGCSQLMHGCRRRSQHVMKDVFCNDPPRQSIHFGLCSPMRAPAGAPTSALRLPLEWKAMLGAAS